jgi:hypothetical protein
MIENSCIMEECYYLWPLLSKRVRNDVGLTLALWSILIFRVNTQLCKIESIVCLCLCLSAGHWSLICITQASLPVCIYVRLFVRAGHWSLTCVTQASLPVVIMFVCLFVLVIGHWLASPRLVYLLYFCSSVYMCWSLVTDLRHTG